MTPSPMAISPLLDKKNLAVLAATEEAAATSPAATTPATPTATAAFFGTQELRLPDSSVNMSGAYSINTDGTYIYWPMAGSIYRYPLAHGEIEQFATTTYEYHPNQPGGAPEQGVLGPILIESNEWLITLDLKAALIYTPIKIRAINLQDGTEKVLYASEEDVSLSAPDTSMGRVAWAKVFHEEGDCAMESALLLYDLATDERREVARACADDNYMWTPMGGIGLSGRYLVAVKQHADSQGGGMEVHLIDVDAGTSEILATSDSRLFGPTISEKWVAWNEYPEGDEIGPETPPSTVIYNLETKERRTIKHEGDLYGLDEAFIVEGRWLYWDYLTQPHWKPIYDLNTGEEFRFLLEGPNESVDDFVIRGDTMIWSVHVRKDQANAPVEAYLRWRTGADPKVLMTQNPP